MITFSVESMANILDEIRPLHLAHWEEKPALRPPGEFNPDYSRFSLLQEQGAALLATARINGRLVGYCQFYVNRHPWTQARFAVCDLLYITPECRGDLLGFRLFRYAHHALEHHGITEFRGFAHRGNREAQVLMKRCGYQDSKHTLYVRRT